MKNLNAFFDEQGFNTRIQPDAEPEPLTISDKLEAMEKELGILDPTKIKVEQRGQVEHENVVVVGTPS